MTMCRDRRKLGSVVHRRRLALPAAIIAAGTMGGGMAEAASSPEMSDINVQLRFLEVDSRDVADLDVAWDEPAKRDGIAFGTTRDGLDGAEIDRHIDELERAGEINILAAPNLISVDGEKALFFVGGEVPVAEDSSKGTDSRPFGLSLAFTPEVTTEDRIKIEIHPSMTKIRESGVNAGTISLSSFLTREAKETFDLTNGRTTVAISGLFERDQTAEPGIIPNADNLLGIGSLLTSERYRRKGTELIILATAIVADPSD